MTALELATKLKDHVCGHYRDQLFRDIEVDGLFVTLQYECEAVGKGDGITENRSATEFNETIWIQSIYISDDYVGEVPTFSEVERIFNDLVNVN